MNNPVLSPAAQTDLLEIRAYISNDLENPTAALSTVKKIMQRIRKLKENPLMGTPLASITEASHETRFLVSGNYLIFYRAVSDCVYIDRVLYGGRDYLRILFGDLPETT